MTRKNTLTSSAMALALLMTAACSSDGDPRPEERTASVTFNIGLDAQTRAARPIELDKYDARVYLYDARYDENNNFIGYGFSQQSELESTELTIEGLTTGTDYKAVFLAVPKGQQPGLSEDQSAYDEATTKYINGNPDETDKDIYRSILSFRASTNASAQYTVLTRQNGAVEVRIRNTPGIAKAELHVEGHTGMMLNDGTGGQVLTAGDKVQLSKEKTDGFDASEVKIRINLLPQEDITDSTGEKNYLMLQMVDGTERKYKFISDQSRIPVYPNQVTWLTIGNGEGDFDVNFSGFINVEDDVWDGWQEF